MIDLGRESQAEDTAITKSQSNDHCVRKNRESATITGGK